MKIFSWVKDKVINGRSTEKKNNKKDEEILDILPAEIWKEELSDRPNGLLSIGTFGNNSGFTGDSQRYASSETSGFSGFTGDSQRYASSERSSCSQNLSNFTVEEVNKLQKELTRQLGLKSKYIRDSNSNSNRNLGRNVEIEQIVVVDDDDGGDGDGDDISKNNNLVSKSENSTKMKRKHLTFLLKKMFVCGGGFAKVPGLKDPVPETRMEKLLRTIIKKKMNSSSSSSSSVKFLSERKNKKKKKKDVLEEMEEITENGCRWVKTDSEYIVLEI